MENITLPILDRDFVGNLIPQKFPFVMVDKVLAFGENFITSGFTVEETNIFTENLIFQEGNKKKPQIFHPRLFLKYKC